MKFGISSFGISKLFAWNEPKTSEKLPVSAQPFVGYPFAGGATKERLPNDLELNDYATHQQGVLKPAVEKANRRQAKAKELIGQLFKKKPDTASAVESAHTAEAALQHEHDKVTFQDVDYVDIYKEGSKNLKKKLEKEGVKIPAHIAWGIRTFAEDEHVKNNVTSKYNNRKIRDDDPALKNIGFLHRRARANSEKKLITYKNIRQFACHKVMADVKTVSSLFKTASNGKDIALNATSLDALDVFFKKNFGVALPKKAAEASKKAFAKECGKYPPNIELVAATVRNHFDLLMKKVPFGDEIKALAEKYKQEELDQARYAKKNVRKFSLEDGSICEKISDSEFKLVRPYGAEARDLRFVKKEGEQNFTLELYSVDKDGNRTPVALDAENAWGQLQQHFDKTSVLKALFGNGENLHQTGFDALFGRLKANEMVQEKIEDFVNHPIKDVLDEKLKNCTTFHGTGFSYNGAHYGENLGIESRSVVMGLIHKKARNGDLAINGSCGFQQDLLWHNGGHIIAIQDITGKTFLDSEHGNDPYTVEEKTTWQSIKPDTATAGMYEIPEGWEPVQQNRKSSKETPIPHTATNMNEMAARWRPRDVAVLSIPMRTVRTENGEELVEERSLIITHKGQAVAASSALVLSEAKDATGNPIDLDAIATRSDLDTLVLKHELQEGMALADDEGNLVKDENGNPVTLLENVVLKRRLADGMGKEVRKNVAGNSVFGGDDFEIAVIERWIRIPLSDNKGGVKTNEHGQVLCTYKKEVQNINPNPEILRDRHFSTMNCVHTQNGLNVPHVQLKPGVDIVGYSVKPGDDTFDRSFISGASKANPDPHPIYVPENTPQQSMIVEAMEIHHGNRTIGRTTQHHVDMIKEEGGMKMNPYYAGRYTEDLDEKYIGHREGNAESVETGIYVRQTQEMFAQLNKVFEDVESQKVLLRNFLNLLEAMGKRRSVVLPEMMRSEDFEMLERWKEKFGLRDNVDVTYGGTVDRVMGTVKRLVEIADDSAFNINPSTLKENVKKRNDALFNRYRQGPGELIYKLFAGNGADQEECVQELQKLLDGASGSEITPGISDDQKLEIRQALEAWANIQAEEQSEIAQTSALSHPRNVKAIDGDSHAAATSGKTASEIEVEEGRAEAVMAALQATFDDSDELKQAASIKYLVDSGLVDHWEDAQGAAAKVEKLTQIIKSPVTAELRSLLGNIQADHAAIERMSNGLVEIQKILDASKGDDAEKTRTELQRYFRSYPGWSIAIGAKAGAAMDSPIENYFHSVAETSAGGLAALGAATGAFAPLLIAMGIEQGKNAHIALRRLNEVKKPYEDYLKKLQGQKAELEKFGNEIGKSLSGNTDKKDLLEKTLDDVGAQIQNKQAVTTNRLKVINQQMNDQVLNAWTSPLLPIDGVAVGVHAAAAAIHGSSTVATVATAAATAGSAALTALGAANLAKSAWELHKIRDLDKKITRLNLGEDSNLRLNFNTYQQNKKAALQYQVGNWSVFTTSSGLLLAAPFTGPAAPILGGMAATGLAVSTMTAFILPKREWRGRTMRAGENTTHINSDFLSTERRKNRLCANLFNQLGMQQNILQKIVDRAIDGDKNKFDTPAWKQFRYQFEQNRSLRWLYTDADRKILSDAISQHPNETKDLQFDLMLRSTDHEINYMAFQVKERKNEVAQFAANITKLKELRGSEASSAPMAEVLESLLHTMRSGLEQEETRLQALNDLRTKLREFSQYQNKDWSAETKKTFDELRLRYMVAHDMLVDSMTRGEIKALVQTHENAGSTARVLTARFGNHTYEGKNDQIIGKDEKLKNVQFEYSDKTFEFLMEKVGKLDARFAHMMCYSMPDKLSYEVSAVMNIYEEELKQRIKDMSKAKASAASDNSESRTASSLAFGRRGMLGRQQAAASSGREN